jgi:hypothetical protein
MKLTEIHIKKAKDRFVARDAKLRALLESLTEDEADALRLTLEEYRLSEIDRAFTAAAAIHDRHGANLMIDLAADNDEERRAMYATYRLQMKEILEGW